MPRATSVRSKKAYTNDNYSEPSVAVISVPNTLEDEIRTRAYLLYEKEGRQDGRDREHWLRAESEVLDQYGLRRG